MSFRIEEKVVLHISDYAKIKNLIKKNTNNSILYPKRKISSLYFDNNKNDMFYDSEEGSLPRKKIRLRTYPVENNKQFYLEEKISSTEGKYKKNKAISFTQSNLFIKQGIFDNNYSNCFPKLWVTYEREYLFYLNCRITLDQSLEFQMPNNKHTLKVYDKLILEIKSKNLETDIFDGKLPFERSRFSKYCEGFRKLYL